MTCKDCIEFDDLWAFCCVMPGNDHAWINNADDEVCEEFELCKHKEEP